MTSPEIVLAAIPWSGTDAAIVVAERKVAVDRLPGAPSEDPFDRLAKAFMAGYPTHSRRAYTADIRAWQQWCAFGQVHPFDARRHHADAWVRVLQTQPLVRTGKPMAASSIARRLSAVSAFYDYGNEVGVLNYSPTAGMGRPKVSDDSATVGLTSDELVALLDTADAHSLRSAALVSLLAYNGVRIDEALSTDVASYSYQRGHRVLRITRKGGKLATAPLAPPTVRALDAYLADDHPTAGPLFLDRASAKRLAYKTAFDLIRRLARKAGIPAAEHITPHSLRHTFVTEALAAGATLQDVQEAAGHRDPRTTRRYDRTAQNLDHHPTYKLAGHLRRSDGS